MVPQPPRRCPDMTIDTRIGDPGRSDHLSLETGVPAGVQQRPSDPVQPGGPSAQETPVDDQHGAILTSPGKLASISVIVPVRDGADTLSICLDAIACQDLGPEV